jgi:hypothetical protein
MVSRGVKINHIYYWCEAFRQIEGEVVAVRYDPFDAGTAYAFVRKQWLQCYSECFATLKGHSERELMLATTELHRSPGGRRNHRRVVRGVLMGSTPAGFPGELLNQPWSARIHYFQTYTMAHPWLVTAREALLNAIHEVPPNSLILVLGPTGVGKTTLRAKIEQLLASELLSVLEVDRGRPPVVSVECIAPESGSFSWRDHFRRLLLQMDEPLVEYKINPEAPVRIGDRVVRFMPGARAVGAEYHHAVERALAFRRPVAVLIDEAQHLARMGSGRRLSDQLDVIKSLANRTKTVHVLIGTYREVIRAAASAVAATRFVE